MQVEICCGDLNSVYAALEGEASRLELCSALEAGGMTPPPSMVNAASLWPGRIDINVLLRPRGGDFLYNERELEAMGIDIEALVEWGANGFVFGALDKSGDVDETFCSDLINTINVAKEEYDVEIKNLTFHRAFDVCRDWRKAMDTIIDLGFDTILTSGQAPTAMQGLDTLREMVEYSRGRIKIMAGSGITPENVAIVAATGVDLVHASARSMVESSMEYRHNGVSMGGGCENEFAWKETDETVVRNIRKIIRNMASIS